MKANKEIILSAGPVMSPTLLLLSGVGDKDELAAIGVPPIHHLPSVGKNVTEHPLLLAPFRINSNDSRDPETRDPVVAADQLEEWRVNKTGPLVDPPLIMLGWFRLNESSEIFQKFPDPSSGNKSAHFEIVFVVRSKSTHVLRKELICALVLGSVWRSCTACRGKLYDPRHRVRLSLVQYVWPPLGSQSHAD